MGILFFYCSVFAQLNQSAFDKQGMQLMYSRTFSSAPKSNGFYYSYLFPNTFSESRVGLFLGVDEFNSSPYLDYQKEEQSFISSITYDIILQSALFSSVYLYYGFGPKILYMYNKEKADRHYFDKAITINKYSNTFGFGFNCFIGIDLPIYKDIRINCEAVSFLLFFYKKMEINSHDYMRPNEVIYSEDTISVSSFPYGAFDFRIGLGYYF